ncbi:MAG: hypothetical protein MUC88_00360 [Planctomycetes bacterium]|jgi:hypothetical protein|nr:hypothetical protein [Planctomycetota bacterium]
MDNDFDNDDGPQLPEKPPPRRRGQKTREEKAAIRRAEREQEIIDLKAKRDELDALRREALSYGYALEGETLPELRQAVERMRAERQGKPPCFRRSYLTNAPQCRICDLRGDCAGRGEDIPAHVEPGDLTPVACRQCDQGLLRVELVDEATGTIRDYACSSTGCQNTLLRQSRWIDPRAPAPGQQKPATVYDLEIEPDKRDPEAEAQDKTAHELHRERSQKYKDACAKKSEERASGVQVKVTRSPVPVEIMDKTIIDYVRQHQPVWGMQDIVRACSGCTRSRVMTRIDWMVKQGILRRRKRVYRLVAEDDGGC